MASVRAFMRGMKPADAKERVQRFVRHEQVTRVLEDEPDRLGEARRAPD